jgi:hypothetical protein
MTDDAVPTDLPSLLHMHGIIIPDCDIAGVADACSALRQAALRVLAADPGEVDIAVIFDPSATW